MRNSRKSRSWYISKLGEGLLISSLPGKASGFICVREMSGKFDFFQGQGIVREFYVVSGKNDFLLKCQGNVREFYNIQFVSNEGHFVKNKVDIGKVWNLFVSVPDPCF